MALHAGSGSSGGSGGAPTDAQYITLATNATLTNERVLTAGSGITLTDGGAGSTLTVALTGGSDATAWHKTGDTIGADKILGAVDAAGGYAVKLLVENQELMRMIDDGDDTQWTGPRLKIGHTGAAFYPNADLVSLKKSLGDQLCVTMQNTHNNAAHPSGSTIVLINNDGTKAGGINIMNDDWPANTDGVNPGEYCCIAFGGPAVYGTQTAEDVRFIANEIQWAHWDYSASDFILDGGNLKVPSGIVTATNAGAQLIIGNATAPSAAGGAFVLGKSGAQSLLGDETGGESKLEWTGKSGDDTVFRLLGGGATGSAHYVYGQIRNANSKNFWLVMTETGAATDYIGKPLYATLAVDAGFGIRCNVNATNDSGFSIGTDQTMHQYGTFQTYNIMPEGGDGVGNIGDGTHRWSLVRAVTITSGDLELEDKDFNSRWTIREAKEAGEDVDTLYAINRRTGKKFKFPLLEA